MSATELPATQNLGAIDAQIAALPTLPETDIGAYRVLGILGQGGMGVVYLAERRDGQFEQRVALKVLPAWAEPGDHGRFLRERQILARMEHQNIARLLDGGLTDDGAPFFAMEYVAGDPLTEYARRERLSLRARISLFLKISDAVHYAHQHLIIHRDLKPNNVLVDADGEPKLLDFGIAKAIDDDAAANSTQTVTRLMTPAYAAPEQILGRAVSTLTDVYALGVILHELLVGARPHPSREGMLAEAAIVQDTIALPSSRNNLIDGVDARGLKGDLDLILLTALKREPERRYASVEAFAKDLRAFLEGRPIAARADSWTYRLSKLVQRNRATSVAACLGFLSLLGALALSVSLAKRAQVQATRAAAVTDFLLGMFESSNPNLSGAANVTARELLDAAALRAKNATDTGAKDDISLSIATAYNRLGLFTQALLLLEEKSRSAPSQLQRAVALKGLGQLAPAVQAASAALALDDPKTALLVERELASLSVENGDWTAAETRLMRLLREAPAGALKVELKIDLARIYSATDRMLQAERMAAEALKDAIAQFGLKHTTVATAQTQQATIFDASSQREQASQAYAQALGTWQQLLGEAHLTTLQARDAYGFFLLRSGDSAGAEREFKTGLAIAERAYGSQHRAVGQYKVSLSTLYAKLGDFVRAEGIAREALQINRSVYGQDSLEVLENLNILATILGNAERFEEANVLFAESLRVAHTLEPTIRERKLSSIEHKAANLLRRQGRCREARPMFLNVISREERPDSAFNLEPTYARLAECELALQDPKSALAHATRAFTISASSAGVPANRSASLVAYALALRANGQNARANAIAIEALADAQKQFGVDSPAYREAQLARQ